MKRMKYCGTAGKPGGNRENKPHPKSMGASSLLEIRVNKNMYLGESELDIKFVRSSGPGGQNVNKVATAVELRFDVKGSTSLPQKVKSRLLSMAGKRATRKGEIVLFARTHRSQDQNRKEAIQRLVTLIRRAAAVPKKRKRTRPSRASKERRIKNKKHRSQIKQFRKSPRRDLN